MSGSSIEAEKAHGAEHEALAQCLFLVPVPPRIAQLVRLKASEMRITPEVFLGKLVTVGVVPYRRERNRLLQNDLYELWAGESGLSEEARLLGADASGGARRAASGGHSSRRLAKD